MKATDQTDPTSADRTPTARPAIHPQSQAVLDFFAKSKRELHEMPPSMARFMFDQAMDKVNIAPPEVASVAPLAIPGPAGDIPARVYTPRTKSKAPLPLVIFSHGGGYTIGSLKSHDPQCRWLANAFPATVVALDYRLAPDHPFPAAVEDVDAAVQWLAANAADLGADPRRIALAGDSAGGNLSVVASHHAKDRDKTEDDAPAIRQLCLIYPNLDLFGDHGSHALFDADVALTREVTDWFIRCYLPDTPEHRAARTHPHFAPLLREDLSGLPRTHVIGAEHDPLRDEGTAYAARLRDAGVPVTERIYAGQVHNFLLWGGWVDDAIAAMDDAATALREGLD